jgi:hypothetical protein
MAAKLSALVLTVLFSTALATHDRLQDINNEIRMRNTLKKAHDGLPQKPLSQLVLEKSAEEQANRIKQ